MTNQIQTSMTRLLFIVLILAFFSCQQEEPIDYTIISGKIINPKGEMVQIFADREMIGEFILGADGTFRDTIKVEPGFYTMVHGRENATIFLKPAYDIDLSLDSEQFDETLNYKGNGAAENNYLAQKYLLDENLAGPVSEVYAMQEDDFLSKVEELYKAKLKLLDEKVDISEEFKELEKRNLEYEKLLNIQRYPNYHSYYAKNPDYKASDKITGPLQNLNLKNVEDYKLFDYYQQLVMGYYNNQLYDNGKNPQKVLEELKQNGFPQLEEDMAKNLSFMIRPGNEFNELYFTTILEMSDDAEFKSKLEEKYKILQTLKEGKPSPVFTDYENHKGGTTSLEDLRGKYVYVDVWATWCGPCKVEIPHLKEVEKLYHGKNIEFVSTSIDRAADHNKWVEMVKDENLGGTQLFADNDWNSKFVKDYAIEGIPRFILIDPNGNIVKADAPRPSNPELIELFKELKI